MLHEDARRRYRSGRGLQVGCAAETHPRARPPPRGSEHQPTRLGSRSGVAGPLREALPDPPVETWLRAPRGSVSAGRPAPLLQRSRAAALDDAVDEVIERVIAAAGDVCSYDPGVLGPPPADCGRAPPLSSRGAPQGRSGRRLPPRP